MSALIGCLVSGGDPYFSSVVSLLNFQGSNGSTTFTDAKGKTWTAKGSAALSTASSPFGGASLLLNGSTDSITTPTSTDYDFGSGNFTYEVFLNPSSVTSGWIFNRRISVSSYTPFGLLFNSGGIRLVMSATAGGSYAVDTTAGTTSTGTWQHLEVDRSGSNMYIFLAGTLINTATFSGALETLSENLNLGASDFSPASPFYNGYVGPQRITKGVARNTTSFTPPPGLFPTH